MDFQDILSYMDTLPHNLVLMWDCNLHIYSLSSDVTQLTGSLQSFDMDQYFNFPTYVHGHSPRLSRKGSL